MYVHSTTVGSFVDVVVCRSVGRHLCRVLAVRLLARFRLVFSCVLSDRFGIACL